jgi:hypothetical protein
MTYNFNAPAVQCKARRIDRQARLARTACRRRPPHNYRSGQSPRGSSVAATDASARLTKGYVSRDFETYKKIFCPMRDIEIVFIACNESM